MITVVCNYWFYNTSNIASCSMGSINTVSPSSSSITKCVSVIELPVIFLLRYIVPFTTKLSSKVTKPIFGNSQAKQASYDLSSDLYSSVVSLSIAVNSLVLYCIFFSLLFKTNLGSIFFGFIVNDCFLSFSLSSLWNFPKPTLGQTDL